MDSCGADQHSTAAATWALLLEASGDSESDDLAAAAVAVSVDADDGDAESCSGGGDDGLEMEELINEVIGKRLVSWECRMRESASVLVAGAEEEGGCCPLLSTEEDAEGDRLFWEACIAHGY